MGAKKKEHKLVIAFHTKEAMLEFAADYLPEGTEVYHADALDREFNGVVPANSYVLRNRGQKPDQMLADRKHIGA